MTYTTIITTPTVKKDGSSDANISSASSWPSRVVMHLVTVALIRSQTSIWLMVGHPWLRVVGIVLGGLV